MKTYTLPLYIFTLLTASVMSHLSAQQWQVIANYGATGDGHVFFVNDTLGYSRSNMTTDGGFTWTPLPIKGADVFFTDTHIGHMVTNTNSGPPTYRRTVDGGHTWEDRSSALASVYGATRVVFPSTSTGFAVSGGHVYRTLDTGTVWSLVHEITGFAIYSVHFWSDSIGYLVGHYVPGSTPYIFQTADRGQTWTSTALPFVNPGPNLYEVHATSPSRVYVIKLDGEIMVSQDQGMTWTSQLADVNKNLLDISFPSPDTGFVVGYTYEAGLDTGLVLMTTDGGLNWNVQPTGYQKLMGRCSFIRPDKGWIAGQDGDVLHMTSSSTAISPSLTDTSPVIYPNPASHFAWISFPSFDHKRYEVKVLSGKGEVIWRQKGLILDDFRINVSDWAKGVYLLQVIDHGKVLGVRKMVAQ